MSLFEREKNPGAGHERNSKPCRDVQKQQFTLVAANVHFVGQLSNIRKRRDTIDRNDAYINGHSMIPLA